MEEELKAYLALATEEYKTLRDESKQASINMWTAMQWGSALIGITIGVGLSQWSANNPATSLAFDIVVPVFSALMMVFWLGEAARFKRVGDYISLVEQKLSLVLEHNKCIPNILHSRWPQVQREAEVALHLRTSDVKSDDDLILTDPLCWEQWLRKRKGRSVIDGHLSKLYAIRLGFFLILSWGSWVVGAVYNFSDLNLSTLRPVQQNLVLATGLSVCVVATSVAVAVGLQLNKTVEPVGRASSGSTTA